MLQGLLISQLEAIFQHDPRLSEVEKYWLQLSSYDLDKLMQFYRLIHLTNCPAAKEEASSSVGPTQADKQIS
jgi:hypothetical protein